MRALSFFVFLACLLAVHQAAAFVNLGPQMTDMVLARQTGGSSPARRSLLAPPANFSTCYDNRQCRNDSVFQADVQQFFDAYPGRSFPKNEQQFLRYLCNLLSPRHSADTGNNLLDDDDVVNMFLEFLGFTYWATELGTDPYPQNKALWWCFLAETTSVYQVWPGFFTNFPSYIQEVVGRQNIANTFNGLGIPLSQGGAGFFVSFVDVETTQPVIPQFPNTRSLYSRASKTLVSIDANGAGTTKPRDFYFVNMDVDFHHGCYPRARISRVLELINLEGTMKWLGLCALCVNCVPGTVCNQLPPPV